MGRRRRGDDEREKKVEDEKAAEKATEEAELCAQREDVRARAEAKKVDEKDQKLLGSNPEENENEGKSVSFNATAGLAALRKEKRDL